MKRLLVVTIALACAAAAFAAWSVAATSGKAGATASAAPAATKLPPLPAAVKARKRWEIGIKCDFPPFGYIDENRRNAGYDVDVARWLARFAFGKGSRVRFTCVTTPSRIPTLQSKRVDVIVSTLTYTVERDQTIDYSTPYYSATGRLLVKTSTRINTLGDLSGKTVATTSSSVYDRWITNCFKDTKLLVFTGTAPALLALKDGRADAFMFDDAFLLEVAMRDPELRLTNHRFLSIPWGIGIRQGDRAMKRWVDSRLAILKKRNQFRAILKAHAAPAVFRVFSDNVPGPKRSFKYPKGDPAQVCP